MSEEIAAHDAEPQQPEKRIPALAEALGYLGGALALSALVVLVFMFWGELGVWGRSGIAAGVALAGLTGGFALERLEEPAAKRLGQFLLAIGVAGVGCAVGFLTDHFTLVPLDRTMTFAKAQEKSSEWAWFLGMSAVAMTGGLVWWRRRTWLQHLVFGVGVGMSALLVLPLIPIEGYEWGPGLVLMTVGIVWGALSLRGLLDPENAGLLLAVLGILGGLQLSAISGETANGGELLAWAVWLGLAVSLLLIVGGVWLKRYVVIGVSAAGLVMFLFELISEVFDMGMGTPVVLIAVSLILLGGAAYWLSRPSVAEKRAASVAAEVAGYAGIAFAIAGGGMLVGEFWDDLNTATRIAVPAVLTFVAYGAALLVGRGDTDSTKRLSRVLFAAGVGGAAATAAMIVYSITEGVLPPQRMNGGPEYDPYRDPTTWAALAASATGIVAGALTWWRRSGMPVAIVTGEAWFMLVTSVYNLFPYERVPQWVMGAVLLAVGLVWVVLGVFERLKPANTVIGVGCVLALIGMTMMQSGPQGEPQAWAVWLGIIVSVAAIGFSIALKRGVLLGFGALGVVVFATTGVQQFFEGEIGAPIMLLIIGVVFIAMAVLVAVVLPRLRRAPAGIAQS